MRSGAIRHGPVEGRGSSPAGKTTLEYGDVEAGGGLRRVQFSESYITLKH